MLTLTMLYPMGTAQCTVSMLLYCERLADVYLTLGLYGSVTIAMRLRHISFLFNGPYSFRCCGGDRLLCSQSLPSRA